MQLKKLTIALTLAAATAGVVGTASAVEQGDWIFHVRAININPNDDSSPLRIDGSPVSGTAVSVDDSNSLDLSLGYMLTDNLAVEVLADPSSQHDIFVSGLPAELNVADGTKVAEVNVLPPTVFLQYHFNPQGKVRPYAGLGLNYTVFFNKDLTNAAKTALGASNLDLDNSFGLAGQVGVDFAMKNDWSFNVDVKYIQIDTEATFDSALGRVAVDVDVNPLVIGVGFGKTF
jgi:outer membrane protein